MENNTIDHKSTASGERTSKIMESNNYDLDSFSSATELLYDINKALTPKDMRKKTDNDSQFE